MRTCQVVQVAGELTCARCGVPFTGRFAIPDQELAAIGGRLDRIFRPCGLPTATSIIDASAARPLQLERAMTQPGAARVDFTKCVHRGEAVGLETCPTCRGTVQIKVFACAIHGRCELAGKLADKGIKWCGECRDYEVT